MFILSCSEKKIHSTKESAKPEKEEIGYYVYFDRAWVLHTKNGCKAVYKDHNMQEVRPVKPLDITRSNLKRVCSQCVSESQIIELEELIKAKEVAEILEADSVVYDPDADDSDND